MSNILESKLPGVGHKFQIEATSGDKLTIVIHDDGRRELYHFTNGTPSRVASCVTLQDSEARQVAGIIGGLTYVPKALPTAEIVIDDLLLEWFEIPEGAYCIGKTIRDLMVRTVSGASIVSIIEDSGKKTINPEADTLLNEEATLIVAGDRKTVETLKHLLVHGRK